MIIDAHHHLWRFSPAEYPWIAEGDTALRRDFLPPDLEDACTEGGVDRTLAVQARQSLAETRWLLKLAHRSPRIAGVVGWVPLADPRLAEVLEPLIAGGPLKGVRHVVQEETDPDFLQRPAIAAGLDALAPPGLVYDLLVRHHQLGQAAACVDRHPDLRFVLDHAGKPPYGSPAFAAWERDLRDVARRSNVWCKLSGLVTEIPGRRWTSADLAPSIAILLEAFGPRRLLFGSDWPVCLLASGYGRWVDTVRDALAPLSADERAAVLGGTAAGVYRL